LTFEDIHEAGAKEFGILWLRANERMIEAATACKMNVYNDKNKRLLSLGTLYVLRAVREKGHI